MSRVKSIFWQWLPLAVSFGLMMCEGPSLQSAIGRLEHPELHLAAWGLTMALSLIVESPVIMLLGTSIALVRDRQSYEALRTFTLRLCLTQTAMTVLVAFTPVFQWITVGLMRQPVEIAAAAQTSMQVMTLWSAAIAWRRFCQGMLVRNGLTRYVSIGTAVRLLGMAITAVTLVLLRPLAGVQMAGTAIMVGVIAEAVASHRFVQPVLRDVILQYESHEPPLTQAAIWRFHLPLALTTLMTLLANPLTSAALARLPRPEVTLAAWPVAFVTMFVLRSGPFAIQEITVAQAASQSRGTVSLFAWLVGLTCTALAVVVSSTSVLPAYLEHAVHLPRELWPDVQDGMQMACLLPLLTALGGWARGLVMAARQTQHVYRAMGLSLGVHAGVLILGVLFQCPPMTLAASALTISLTAEFAYLYHKGRAAEA